MHQAIALERLLDGGIERDFAETFRIIGLDDVIGGAETHGLDDRRRLLAAREHDDLQLGTRGLQRFQRLQAVHARHRDVEQHDVGRLALANRRDDFIAARIGARFVAAQREERTEISGKSRVVVDDRDVGWTPFVGGAVRRFGAGFPAGHDAVRMRSARDARQRRLQVDQHPVKEVDAR